MKPFILEDKVIGSVMDLLNETFPVPLYDDCNDFVIGTILNTKNSRFRTNATIFDITKDGLFQIVTDIGNVLVVEQLTLEQWYLPPIQKRLKEWNV